MESGTLNENQARDFIEQVISGVDFMHRNGVVHRDMNPTNVFMSSIDPMHIKILDFNVSKLIDNATTFS